jgi:plastocyanin
MKRLLGRLASCLVALTVIGALGPIGMTARAATASKPLYTYNGPVPLPDNGAYFGAYVPPDPHNGPDRRTALTNYETMVGRQMAIERVYYLWNEDWPNADDYWSAGMGRILYISWNASPDDGSGCRKWADIAAGVYDADIHAQTAKIKLFPYNFFFSFHHEPTTAPPDGQSCGTPADYQAAWRHIHDTFVADGVTNVTYSITYTAQNFLHGKADDFYPGDDIIDTIAADGYNWFGCQFHNGPWREMSEIFQPFYDFGVEHNKPLIVAEYGSGEDPDVVGKKGQWFTNGSEALKNTMPLIKGVTYFNVGNGGTSCDRYVDSTPTSLSAFQAMGADPYFNPPPTVTDVSISDTAYTPKNATIAMGTGLRWTNNGTTQHTATDTSMGALFDSGNLAPGGTYLYFFVSAGKYPYYDTLHTSLTGNIKVPVLAQPHTGNVNTTFTITWAANHAPDGFAFDVQIKRPGSTKWKPWYTLQNVNFQTFKPDAGTGTYSFRARYHNTTTDEKSAYSPVATIVVS